MFRVQLAYNTLKMEIETLKKQTERREDALRISTGELDDDRRGVMQFVE